MNLFNKGYALVVGVANYAKFRKLPPMVVKDAEDISQLLTDPATCGYPADHVRLLTDRQATAQGIREGLGWLADQTSSDDTAIFFFSGHGARVESGPQAGNYLITVETNPRQLQNTAIDSVELTTLLRRIKAGRLLVLLDCCHAGGLGEAKEGLITEFKSGLDEDLYARLSEGRGRAIIASSRSDEVSLLFYDMDNSLFTHYLLKALRGEAKPKNDRNDRNDGLIRVWHVFEFVSEHVTKHDQRQHPIFKGELENNFPIALYAGGQKNVKTNTQPTTPLIQNPQNIPLPPQAEVLLKTMFATYQRVVIKKEFGGGFSEGRVFSVRPIKNNRAELEAVVKMGRIGLIEQEWQAFQTYIHYYFPNVTRVEGKPVYPANCTWGALRYRLAGDGVFPTQSLSDYCRQATIEDIRYVLKERLFMSFRKSWESAQIYPEFSLQSSYDYLLPVNLLLELAEAPANATIHPLNPQTYTRRPYVPGDYVRLTGFRVTRVDEYRQLITLNLPLPEPTYGLPDSYRIRLQSVQDFTPYQENEEVQPLVAVIRQTRQTRLQKKAQNALGPHFDLAQEELTLPNGVSLPNPLKAWPSLLRHSLDVRTSYIHGDLNLQNVLVEKQSRTIHLIDFASARQDHVLHDLLLLEREFLLQVVPEILKKANLGVEAIYDLYQQLDGALRQPNRTAPEPEKPFTTLLIIRQMAADLIFKQGDWTEYYYGLTLYLLGALKFDNLDEEPTAPMPKQIAFWAAATTLKLLETPPAYDEDEPAIEPHTPDKQDTPMTTLQQAKIKCRPTYHDLYSRYQFGACCLVECLDQNDPHYGKASILQERLTNNIEQTRLYGETPIFSAERYQILNQLDKLAQDVLNISFYKLCQESN